MNFLWNRAPVRLLVTSTFPVPAAAVEGIVMFAVKPPEPSVGTVAYVVFTFRASVKVIVSVSFVGQPVPLTPSVPFGGTLGVLNVIVACLTTRTTHAAKPPLQLGESA
jgi:hypothetical protein